MLPRCYTARCTCNFLNSLRRTVPGSVMETAIYTLNDGIVDSRYCRTGNCKNDFEVPGTHIGLAFNASAYKIIAERLAEASTRTGPVSVSRPRTQMQMRVRRQIRLLRRPYRGPLSAQLRVYFMAVRVADAEATHRHLPSFFTQVSTQRSLVSMGFPIPSTPFPTHMPVTMAESP